MQKILVTGGAGFIGSSLVDRLIQDSNNYVVAMDNLCTGSREKLPQGSPSNYRFINSDVNDLTVVKSLMQEEEGFDYIFHYAALVGVQRTIDNPLLVLQDIEGFKHILGLAKNSRVKRVFYASSSEVYGEPFEHPQNEETTPLNSRLPYAVVKNIGEVFLRAYKKTFGLDYTIFRFFNTFGPKQSQDFVMTRFVKSALSGADITIYGDGSQTRTFCYIDDNIDATTHTLYRDKMLNQTINIGSDNEVSILKLAKTVIDITGSSSKIVFLPPLAEGDMKRRKPDTSKMKALLERDPIDLASGIEKLLISWGI